LISKIIFRIKYKAIRGKWRILDGKEDEWSDMIFGAPRL
jgi:hypothetical protein